MKQERTKITLEWTCGIVRLRILDMCGDAAAGADAAQLAVSLARKGAGILEVVKALAVGAKILEDLDAHQIATACRTEDDSLLRGCADPAMAQTLLTAAQRSTAVAVTTRNEACTLGEELTPKELEVLRLLATPLTRNEIGRRLYVSLNTVKTHQRALYRKLGVENRTAAVKRARELGRL
jgi:ATP/maltotriose-dependent transcriptional regulator MalT